MVRLVVILDVVLPGPPDPFDDGQSGVIVAVGRIRTLVDSVNTVVVTVEVCVAKTGISKPLRNEQVTVIERAHSRW